MNSQQWTDLQLPMVWSVYGRESLQAYRNRSPEEQNHPTKLGEVELDLRAPQGLPDGTYTVRHYGGGRSEGAIVLDGAFEPSNIANVCLEAVCASQGRDSGSVLAGDESIDEIFIEGFGYDPETNLLEVYTGS